MKKSITSLIAATAFAFALNVLAASSIALGSVEKTDDLEQRFLNPPEAARPWVYWFWMNGNISKEGITADLEAMHRIGIGGALMMNVGLRTPHGPHDFNSPSWRALYSHAASECVRLGMKLTLHPLDGWATSGGKWIAPEQSMKMLVWKTLEVEGPTDNPVRIEQPFTREDFYEDIAVLAFPEPEDNLLGPDRVTVNNQPNNVLFDGDLKTGIGGAIDVLAEFDKPVELSTVLFPRNSAWPSSLQAMAQTPTTIEVSADGVTFEKVSEFDYNVAIDNGDHFSLTASFPTRKAKAVRIRMDNKRPEKIVEIELRTAPRVHLWEVKSSLARERNHGGETFRIDAAPWPGSGQMKNLSGRLHSKGRPSVQMPEFDADGAPRGMFRESDPLGINVADIANLNSMPDQTLLHTGLIDVTKAPFNADASGVQDSTRAIADAVFFGRHHKLAVYFPAGDYLVSDTIPCMAGWHDERTPNHKYLPWVETWPCVLIGDRRGSRKPRIMLTANAPGFDNPDKPKPVLDFDARKVKRENTTDPLPGKEGSTNYQQLLYGIDVEIREGNPGAAAVTFNAAEGSTIQDCTFDVGDGFTGIFGGPGSGGAIFNVTVKGGSVGMFLYSSRPTCTLAGCRFMGQRDAGLDYAQRGPLTLVGCEFSMDPGVPAVIADVIAERGIKRGLKSGSVQAGDTTGLIRTPNGSASLVDCRIDYSALKEDSVAIHANAAIYVENTWVRNAAFLMTSASQKVQAPDAAAWTHVVEMAASHNGYTEPMQTPIYIDGKKEFGIVKTLRKGDEPPLDLRSRHLWDEAMFPYWDQPGCVNVKNPPYNAKGDGKTDDTAALQQAIDEQETVFLPKGAYRVTKTLRLRPSTRLFGISPAYCMIVPSAVPGGDFTSPENPKPVIQTADAEDAGTILAFFSVFMPREEGKACYWLDLASANTLARCILPIIGYTIADLDPLKQGIYPWTNWKWQEMDSFSLQTGLIQHFWEKDDWEPWPDSHEDGMPNWPMVRVHGNGSGRWYLFVDLDLQAHGLRHRRMLVENTKGPFAVYHAQLQYGHGAAEIEVTDSENVAVYGIKNERPAVALWIRNSRNILLTGIGGPCVFNKDRGKVAVENSSGIVLSGLTPDFPSNATQRPSMRCPFVVATMKDGTRIETGPYERPALFKITSDISESEDARQNKFDKVDAIGRNPNAAQILDLTGRLDANGALDWDVPNGRWRIVRTGMTSTGKHTAPATYAGAGLEADKMDNEAIRHHWNSFGRGMVEQNNIAPGNPIWSVHTDSWESNLHTWGNGFAEAFKKRRGYAITPWLPVLATGTIVSTAEESERFLWDYRRTLADLIAENFYGQMKRQANESGLLFQSEAAGRQMFMYDPLNYAAQTDIYVGEFWMATNVRPDCKVAASAAHTYGRPFAAAEAWTSGNGSLRDAPFDWKPLGDHAFTAGINRVIIHRYCMQPFNNVEPGMTFGPYGINFERTQTFWNNGGRAWVEYLTRCQALLQAGTFVADVIHYIGHDAPNYLGHRHEIWNPIPPGYDYDGCNLEILKRLTVEKDGTLSLPSGMRYRVLLLPNREHMTIEAAREVERIVNAGATVVGPKPLRTPGLYNWQAKNEEMAAITARVWDRVLNAPLAQVLSRMAPADFDYDAPDGRTLNYIHRRTEEADFYFIANLDQSTSFDAVLHLRVTGKQPELWDPSTGAIRKLDVWREVDGVSELPVHFDPAGSWFVVFRQPAQPPSGLDPDLFNLTKDSPSIETNASENFTMALWLKSSAKLDVPQPGTPAVRVGGQNFAMYPAPGHEVWTEPAAGVGISAGKDGLVVLAHSARYFAPLLVHSTDLSDWTHVAVTAQDNAMTLYVNGQAVQTALSPGRPLYASMGVKHGRGTPAFNGMLSALFQTSKPLSADAVRELMRKTAPKDKPEGIELSGPWTVSFPPNRHAPAEIELSELLSWTEHPHPGVKYFSGTATYRKTFVFAASDRSRFTSEILLDLGEVKNVAEVTLNKKYLGTLWKPPFQVDVTDTLLVGENRLEIKLTNLWPNRLIGDEKLHPDPSLDYIPIGGIWGVGPQRTIPDWVRQGAKSPVGRTTWILVKFYEADSPLLPSGLLGPVRLKGE